MNHRLECSYSPRELLDLPPQPPLSFLQPLSAPPPPPRSQNNVNAPPAMLAHCLKSEPKKLRGKHWVWVRLIAPPGCDCAAISATLTSSAENEKVPGKPDPNITMFKLNHLDLSITAAETLKIWVSCDVWVFSVISVLWPFSCHVFIMLSIFWSIASRLMEMAKYKIVFSISQNRFCKTSKSKPPVCRGGLSGPSSLQPLLPVYYSHIWHQHCCCIVFINYWQWFQKWITHDL